MSATMTMTLPPTSSDTTTIMSTTRTKSCCPNCGLSLPALSDSHSALAQAQKQIEDLQAQVRLLNQKASAAVDRWADYEDELSRLRAASTTSAATTTNTTNHNRPHTPTPSIPESSPRSSFLGAGAASRISQLLSPRKSTPNLGAQAATNRASVSSPKLSLPNGRPHTSHNRSQSASPSTDDLLEALTREKELRAAAEGKLDDTSKEVEELSATLFEQANEMVATERKARAKLEERVSVLERRDGEKKTRLDRLEGAMGRIERMRALLEDADGDDDDDA